MLLITREEIATKLGEERSDNHDYYFLLITTKNSSKNRTFYDTLTRIMEGSAGEWKKVDTENVQLYFGHFASVRDAAANRLVACNCFIMKSSSKPKHNDIIR